MLCQACVCMGINVKLLLNIIMLDKFVCGLSKKHTVRAINFMLLWCFIIGIVTYPDIPITIELLLCGLLLLYIAAIVLHLKINCKSIKKACLKQTDKPKNMIIKDISIDIIREALFWGTLFYCRGWVHQLKMYWPMSVWWLLCCVAFCTMFIL